MEAELFVEKLNCLFFFNWKILLLRYWQPCSLQPYHWTAAGRWCPEAGTSVGPGGPPGPKRRRLHALWPTAVLIIFCCLLRGPEIIISRKLARGKCKKGLPSSSGSTREESLYILGLPVLGCLLQTAPCSIYLWSVLMWCNSEHCFIPLYANSKGKSY